MKIKIKKLDPDAIIPSYAHMGDAGMDVYANETIVINPGESVKVKTGIAMEIPDGYVGLMWDRSGMSTKNKIKSLGGVIDSGYRGESLVGLINLSDVPYTIEKGHKIIQMLIQKVERVDVVEADELTDTTRGEGGFGSTGK
ncbi:MAG: dUTP diphosphatase [Minisyncoccia bacterium]